MSLVIATNKDQDNSFRQDESVYSAYSFKNDLSSTYTIPKNSQVALQSTKVNLDGRITISANNSWWYDYFGSDLSTLDTLDDTGTAVPDLKAIDVSTSYPRLQDLDVPKGEILELTTDELAERIKKKHREYHPNLFDKFDVDVTRTSGLDFLGFEFKYNQNSSQNASTKPDSDAPFFDLDSAKRYSYSSEVFTRLTGTYEDPAVGILLGKPLDLSNGSMVVNFSNSNASKVEWGIGLSRDCPNPYLNEDETYTPFYFDSTEVADESFAMGIEEADYFEDFGVHRNNAGELVVRHATCEGHPDPDMIHTEVKYWNNTNSSFADLDDRYDLNANASGYTKVKYVCQGEKVAVYMVNASGEDLLTSYGNTQDKNSYFKPITQTCWCLHPVLYVGADEGKSFLTNSLTLESYSGLNIDNYDSRGDSQFTRKGWFETASLLSNIANWNAINRCRALDMREILDTTKTNDPYDYIPVGLSNSAINHKYAMILSPNSEYTPTFGSACSDLYGFAGRSLVIDGIGTFPDITFASDSPPSLDCMKSIFCRLNGFGQQVLNARTGNKSTILSHLPTADSRASSGTSQRIFYEPKNLIWLDLKNPYDMIVSDFSIDFVYSNEQYAKILQGQSIVCLYFRTKESMMTEE